MCPWFVWSAEYPDDGSMLVRAGDAEQAKALAGMGDVVALEAQPVGASGDDVHSLLVRAAAEGEGWAAALPAAIRIRLVGALCTALIEYADAAAKAKAEGGAS